MKPTGRGPRPTCATAEELVRLVDGIDETRALEILVLRPTLAQVEEAALWAKADGDWPAPQGRPLEQAVAQICGIMLALRREEEHGARLVH